MNDTTGLQWCADDVSPRSDMMAKNRDRVCPPPRSRGQRWGWNKWLYVYVVSSGQRPHLWRDILLFDPLRAQLTVLMQINALATYPLK
jgi:hypothetical protein